MKRNCNLELKLLPPSESFNHPPSNCYYDTQYHNSKLFEVFNDNNNGSSTIIEQEQEQKQMMTIFYNGQMDVSAVTELQARTIILLASQEMEETSCSAMNRSSSGSPTTPLLMQPHTPSPTGMSMKRSLQRFLQKRNNRAQAALPYHH